MSCCRLDNLVFDEHDPSRVLAVLDWELSTIGNPLADLAYACMCYHLPPVRACCLGVPLLRCTCCNPGRSLRSTDRGHAQVNTRDRGGYCGASVARQEGGHVTQEQRCTCTHRWYRLALHCGSRCRPASPQRSSSLQPMQVQRTQAACCI
jgi:Phosphotransferase enzyme family